MQAHFDSKFLSPLEARTRKKHREFFPNDSDTSTFEELIAFLQLDYSAADKMTVTYRGRSLELYPYFLHGLDRKLAEHQRAYFDKFSFRHIAAGTPLGRTLRMNAAEQAWYDVIRLVMVETGAASRLVLDGSWKEAHRDEFMLEMVHSIMAKITELTESSSAANKNRERNSMEVVRFYRGETGNQNGDMFADILKWNNFRLETDHDWVQWVFPSCQRSMFREHAPVLTAEEAAAFQTDSALAAQMTAAFTRFLTFLELTLAGTPDGKFVVIQPGVGLPAWLNGFNHNMLRVTRVLMSLRECGLPDLATALFKYLAVRRDSVGPNTWLYWEEAMSLPPAKPL